MLQQKGLIRTNPLKFFVNEYIVHGSSAFQSNEHVAEKSNHHSTLLSTEISTGETLKQQDFPFSTTDNVYMSSEYLVQHNIIEGKYRVFHYSSNTWIDEIETNEKVPTPSTKKILCYTQPQNYPNFFIFCVEDEYIQTLVIKKKNDKFTIRVSPYFRLNILLTTLKIKSKGQISSICSHPNLPIIILSYSLGTVLVLSFERNYQYFMSATYGSNADAGDEENRPDEEDDENGEGKSEEVKNTDSSLGGFFRSKQSKIKDLFRFSVIGILEIPSTQVLAQFNSSVSYPAELSPTEIKISFDGKTAGIIWSQLVFAVYDLASFFSEDMLHHILLGNPANPNAKNEYKVILPSGFYPVIQAPGTETSFEYRLQKITYHPNLPLVFLLLSKTQLIEREPQIVQTKKGQILIPQFSRVPLPPLILAISRQKKHYLSAIGSYEFEKDLFISSSTIDYNPDVMRCTPTTALLYFSFPLLANSSSPVGNLIFTFAITDHWKEVQGLKVYSQPLNNSIDVPPEVYLFGLLALSQRASFQKKEGTNNKDDIVYSAKRNNVFSAFKCEVKAGNSLPTSLTVTSRQGLPSLFTLKPSSHSENYDLFEIDYLPSIFNHQKDHKGIASKYLGQLPLKLETDPIKESIKQTYKWMKLEKNDYWLPYESSVNLFSFDQSLYEKKNAQLIPTDRDYHFYPTSLESWINAGGSNKSNEDPFVNGLLCVKGKIRKLMENRFITVLPSMILDEITNDLVEPCVTLIRILPEGNKIECVYLSFLDLTFVANQKNSSTFGTIPFMIGLEKHGKSIKILDYDQQKSILQCTRSIALDNYNFHRCWFSNQNNHLHFLANQIGHNEKQLLTWDFTNFSNIGVIAPATLLSALPKFLFSSTEFIRNLQFQPISNNSVMSNTPDLLQSFNLLGTGANSTIAILTNERLVILTADNLTPISIVIHSCSNDRTFHPYHPKNQFHRLQHAGLDGINGIIRHEHVISQQHQQQHGNQNSSFQNSSSSASSSIFLKEKILSMNYLGNVILFESEMGIVRYLLPISTTDLNTFHRKSSLQYQLILRALGKSNGSPYRLTPPSVMGPVFSFPRNLSANFPSSVELTGLFPDRLMIVFADRYSSSLSLLPQATNRFSFHSLYPAVAFRPWNPVEPLLMGLLSAHLQKTQFGRVPLPSLEEDLWLDYIMTMISYYSPVIPSEAMGGNNRMPRIVPSHHLMSMITFHWEVAGNDVEGIEESKTSSSSSSTVLQQKKQKKQQRQQIPIKLANILLYSSNRTTNKHAELFASGKWISSGIRCFYHLQNQFFNDSILEILFENHSNLIDLLTGHETFGGNHLPLMNSPLAKRLAALGQEILLLSSSSASSMDSSSSSSSSLLTLDDFVQLIRLFDIAGYPEYFLIWLFSNSSKTNLSKTQLLSILKEFYQYRSSLSSKTIHSVLQLGKQFDITDTSIYQDFMKFAKFNRILPLSNITKTQRNKSLFASLMDLELLHPHHHQQHKSTEDKSSKIQFEIFRKSCQQYFMNKFHGFMMYGPYWNDSNLFPLQIFAFDILEEFMGTQQHFEIVSIDSNSSFNGNTMENGMNSSSLSSNSKQFFKEQSASLPSFWVDNIGYGRELDKISGYYRFSDVYYPNEIGFLSTNQPYSRLSFVDLSRFDSPGIELFYDNNNHNNHPSEDVNHQFIVEYSQSNINAGDRHDSTKLLCDVVHLVKTNSSSSSAASKAFPSLNTPTTTATPSTDMFIRSGLRLFIPRGSALDIGCYHYDVHRNKLTMELSLAFMNNLEILKKSLKKQDFIIAERRITNSLDTVTMINAPVGTSLWKIWIDVNGFFNIQIGNSNKLTSTFNIFNYLFESTPASSSRSNNNNNNNDFDNQNNEKMNSEFTNFIHIAFCLDASNTTCDCTPINTNNTGNDFKLSYSNPIKISFFIDGEKIIDNHTTQKPIDLLESQLSKSFLFIFPNVNVSYRTTEFRLWAEIRSAQELQDQRENYLLLAEKRYRLQMQLKGTRKLFSSYRDIIVGESSTQLKEYLLLTEKDKEMTQGKESSSLAKPSLAMPSSSLGPPGGLGGPGLLGAPVVAPVGGLAAPGAAAGDAGLTARQRRMSTLKGGVAPVNPVGAPGVPTAAPPAAEPAAQHPTTTAVEGSADASHLPPAAPMTARQRRLSALSQAPPVNPLAPPPSASHEPLKQEASHKEATPIPAAPAVASPSPAALSSSSSTPQFLEYSEALDTYSPNFRFISLIKRMATRRTKFLTVPFSFPAIRSHSMECILSSSLTSTTAPIPTTEYDLMKSTMKSLSLPEELTHFDEEKDLLLLHNRFKPQLFSQIAVCTSKSLEILDVSSLLSNDSTFPLTIRRIVAIPLTSTPLAYFYFLTAELMILITPNEGFTWKPSLSSTNQAREVPIKILYRIDLPDIKEWMNRIVLDVNVSPERWTMLITCQNHTSSTISHSLEENYAERSEDYLVSVHHAKSGKAIAFRAMGGVFRSPNQLLLVFWENHEWKLVLLDLTVVLTYLEEHGTSRAPATPVANPNYQRPITYSELIFEKMIDRDGHTLPEMKVDGSHPPLKALWSLAIPFRPRSSAPASSLSSSLGVLDHLVVNIYQISDKIFLLFSNGDLVLVGGSSPKVYGQQSLFPSSSTINQILFLTSDFANADDPILLGMTRSDAQADSLKLMKVHLKPLTQMIKNQFEHK